MTCGVVPLSVTVIDETGAGAVVSDSNVALPSGERLPARSTAMYLSVSPWVIPTSVMGVVSPVDVIGSGSLPSVV